MSFPPATPAGAPQCREMDEAETDREKEREKYGDVEAASLTFTIGLKKKKN